MRISPFALATSLSPPTGVLPPSSPSSPSHSASHSLSSLSLFLFISSWESRAHQLSLPSAAPSLPLSQSLVNIKGMLVQPLASLSPWLCLPRSLCLMLSFTPTSPCFPPSHPSSHRQPPPTPPTFFLSVKAAFQMLISSQSKRETERRRDD